MAAIQYDEYGRPIDPETGQPLDSSADPNAPASAASAAPSAAAPAPAAAPFSAYGNPLAAQAGISSPIASNPYAPMEERYTQNANFDTQRGNQLADQGMAATNYYGQLIPQYQTQLDSSLSDLKAQPGYNDAEQGKIGVDYNQFNTSNNPGLESAETGDPQYSVKAMDAGLSNEGQQLNSYGQNLSGQLGNYDQWTGGALDNLGNKLDQSQDFNRLNSAVDNKALGYQGQAKQMSNGDVQDIETAAGTTIGNKYRSAEDQLRRDAAASGNSSPLAIAAANARLEHQSAADAGDSMTNARIAALQSQATRAQQIEAQREGATQTQSAMQAAAGTTEQSQKQAAAALAGQAGIGVATNAGNAGINAANTYGQTALNQQNTMTGQKYGAVNTAEQTAATRAQQLAAQQYGQGTASASANSQGAQTIGNARIAGNNAYRSGVAGQQQGAQQGAAQGLATQNQTYGLQTGAVNQATGQQGNFALGKPSLGDSLAGVLPKAASSLIRGASAAAGAADGGFFTEPTNVRIAEGGDPEMVVPMGRYGKPQLVTKPTVARLENEMVIPMRYRPGNKVNAGLMRAS